jgi:hypothetical protein
MNSQRDVQVPLDDTTSKASYEKPALKRLGSVRDLTLGVMSPQVDVLFVGSL